VAEKTMVYGRYNELVHGDYFMVYRPTNITHEDSNMKRTFYMDLLRPIGIDIVNVYGYVRYNITARAISPLNNYGE